MAFNWLWFDPLLLYSVDFEIAEFIRASFNFIYKEQTTTLGLAKWWVWLIMPLMAALMSLHAAANWLDSLQSLVPTAGVAPAKVFAALLPFLATTLLVLILLSWQPWLVTVLIPLKQVFRSHVDSLHVDSLHSKPCRTTRRKFLTERWIF